MKKFIKNNEMLDGEFEFICDFIKLRNELGLTQKEMSIKSNVLRTKIAKVEAGVASPNLRSLTQILEPLGYRVGIVKNKKN